MDKSISSRLVWRPRSYTGLSFIPMDGFWDRSRFVLIAP